VDCGRDLEPGVAKPENAALRVDIDAALDVLSQITRYEADELITVGPLYSLVAN